MGENGVVPSFLTYNVSLGGWDLMCKLWERMSDEEDLPLRNVAFAWVIQYGEKGFLRKCLGLWKICLKGRMCLRNSFMDR